MYQEVFQLHADLLKALAQPRRLEIINLLQNQELSVTEMQEMLALPQANLSQHLQVLRKQGVVIDRRDGKQIFYRLAHKNFLKANHLLRDVLIKRHEKTPLAKVMNKEVAQLLPVVIDPVCGMRVSKKTAAASHPHKGSRFYFCARGCLNKFKKSPQVYSLTTKTHEHTAP
ncbi:MAG: metalloregulator ArsR/SmtB family transcription factor [Candidatus Andersenbacteria bacterium]